MSHPQAEDLFCQAHVTFPNTLRQPPILVDSKSVLIVFIIDGALFLFQLLFDLQCTSMGALSVYYWRMSVCVCVEVKNYWDNNCSCFFRAWPSHSYESISPLRNVKIIQGTSFTSQKRLIPSPPNSDIGFAPNVHPCFLLPNTQWRWHLI